MEIASALYSNRWEIVKQWMDCARHAASGGNLQPWIITIKSIDEENVMLKLTLEKPPGEYFTDCFGAGALASLGCLWATLDTTASSFGLRAKISNINGFDDFWATQLSLEYRFIEIETDQVKLNSVYERRTFRGPYKSQIVAHNIVEKMHPQIRFKNELLNMNSHKSIVLQYLKDTTYLRLTEKSLFLELMKEVTLREQDPKVGLPLDTLGLSKFTEMLFKKIRQYKLHFGSRFMHAGAVYESVVIPLKNCSHIFYLQSNGPDAENWIQLGYDFQTIWFYLTENKVVLQPFANNLIIYNFKKKPGKFPFSESNKSLLEKWTLTLNDHLGIDTNTAGIMFRIGFAKKKAPPSPRKDLEQIMASYSF